MFLKGKGAAKILLIILTISVMLSSLVTTAFAAGSAYVMDSNGTLTEINLKDLDNREVLQIPANVIRIGSGVVKEGRRVGFFEIEYFRATDVKEIVIPANVEGISNGAFSNCTNLTKVTIDNYKDSVDVENGAFPDGVKVVYKEKPTTTQPAPTKPAPTQPAPTQPAPTKPAPQKPTAAPTVAPKPEATKPEETTEVTTEPQSEPTVEITERVPFAEAKSELDNMNVWDQLINQSTAAADEPTNIKNPIASTASYAMVVVVAFSAIVLGYMKFKR